MKNLLLTTLVFLSLFCSARGQVIVTCAGGGSAGLGDGGPAVYAELNSPFGVNLDDSGNLYICDVLNQRVRKVTKPNDLGVGIITTIAGNGTIGYSGDNLLGVNAQLHDPMDVAIDHHGNVYFVDQSNNCIRKVKRADTITTIAGSGIGGYNGDGILATTAKLNNPTGVAVDNIGNVYIADRGNYRIRKVDTGGVITTIAGTGIAGFSPDGGLADTAKMSPFLVRINSAGTIYFADSARIRKISSAGIITTVAGNGVISYSGDSGLATLAAIDPAAIAIDISGNLFIAEASSNRIRKVDTSSIIYTIAGNGVQGFYGDNGSPLLAELNVPAGVAVSNAGDVYIGDAYNYRIRLVTAHPLRASTALSMHSNMSIIPNPCYDHCTIDVISPYNEQVQISIMDITGAEFAKFSTVTNHAYTIKPAWPPGVYIINAVTEHEHFTKRLMVQ